MKEKFLNNLHRFVTGDITGFFLYLFWFLAFIVLVGFLGIFPLTQNILKKALYLAELKTVNTNLGQKIEDLKEAKVFLERTPEKVAILHKYTSSGTNLPDFMVSLYLACGLSSYSITNFKPSPYSSGAELLFMEAAMSGYGHPVDLLARLENMKELVSIHKLVLTHNSYGNFINLEISLPVYQKPVYQK